MSKKKSRPRRTTSATRSQGNRRGSAVAHRTVVGGHRSAGISLDRFTVSEIVGQPSLFGYFEAHPLQALLTQIALLSVVAAGAGTLISKLVPDSSASGIGHGVYVAGVVLLLLIETSYQWLLRSAVLTIEKGALKIAAERFSHIPESVRSSLLEKDRDVNEVRLKRLFEPLQRVVLIAVALSILFVAQRSGEGSSPEWVWVLSTDWAMTLMFAYAGLLWQLKNPDNVGKLLEHLRIECYFTSFGERFWIVGLVCPTMGSMVVISWAFWPWGTVSIIPLLVALYFVARYSEQQPPT